MDHGRVGDPLKVAMVAACPFPQPRGTPIRIQRMAEALTRRGHRVELITYHLGTGRLEQPVIVHRTRRLPTYRKTSPGVTYQKLLLLDVLLASKAARVLRHRRFDIVHAHHYEGLLVAAVARPGTRPPLVYDAHTLLGSELPYSDGLGMPAGVKRAIGRWLDHRLPRLADHVIAVADPIRDGLVADGAVAETRISVISNGIELDRFEASAPANGRPADGAQTLIFSGNLAAYQRIDLLLEAFVEVRGARPGTRLQLVTDSSFDPYEAKARTLGIRGEMDIVRADFDGVPAMLAAADVALNPRTDGDGVPVKLLNYMAAAKAAVSFAGCAPVVRHGETGWLVDGRDAHSFAGGVLTLLANPRLADRIGRNARSYVEEHHGWASICERIEHVYAGLARRRTRF